ncbi:hypothetical protein F0344_19165 [Streptomyces finlayi]|uniref:Uncharacterized protein n=1 Tax=Streptomyces finlayi TaxID=67296 RepID=A0A7G7BVE4_9ACTN|nr:hypothetical protein [Streptomyces finlayi]QNE79309.1 hypothetical protein F0344_19165 [Streptomyces finlayi]
MRQRHHFHIDHAGHSVTATVETGHTVRVEVLVDGKQTGYATTHGDRPVAVRIELPTDPPAPATVRVKPGPGLPACLFEVPVAEPRPMSPRAY